MPLATNAPFTAGAPVQAALAAAGAGCTSQCTPLAAPLAVPFAWPLALPFAVPFAAAAPLHAVLQQVLAALGACGTSVEGLMSKKPCGLSVKPTFSTCSATKEQITCQS